MRQDKNKCRINLREELEKKYSYLKGSINPLAYENTVEYQLGQYEKDRPVRKQYPAPKVFDEWFRKYYPETWEWSVPDCENHWDADRMPGRNIKELSDFCPDFRIKVGKIVFVLNPLCCENTNDMLHAICSESGSRIHRKNPEEFWAIVFKWATRILKEKTGLDFKKYRNYGNREQKKIRDCIGKALEGKNTRILCSGTPLNDYLFYRNNAEYKLKLA